MFSWLRVGEDGTAPVLVVTNFTPVPRHGYRLGLPMGGRWVERMNTDAEIYGGSGMGNLGGVEAETVASHGRAFSARFTIPPLATLYFTPEAAG